MPSNLTGVCDRSIQPRIEAALAGTEEIAKVIDAVEPRLWNLSTVLPILQDTTIVAAGPRVRGRQSFRRGPGRDRRRRREMGETALTFGVAHAGFQSACAVNAEIANTRTSHSGGRASSIRTTRRTVVPVG